MITLKRFGSRMEAEIARGLLESSGIYSLVVADDAGGELPGIRRGIMLQVMPDDATLAQEILSAPMIV